MQRNFTFKNLKKRGFVNLVPRGQSVRRHGSEIMG